MTALVMLVVGLDVLICGAYVIVRRIERRERPMPARPEPDLIDDAWLELLGTGAGGAS